MLVKAMSKIYLAGEYAILMPGSFAILAPVKKYTYLEIEKSDEESVESTVEDKQELLKYAREQAFIFAKKYEKFSYKYTTDLYTKGTKFGLGSSASVVVVTIKAILEYMKIKYTKADLFILSVRALRKAGNRGSMGDVACICYEDLILYQSIDENEKYMIKKIKPKGLLKITAFWSGKPASTAKQISPIKKWYNTEEFLNFVNISNKYTLELEKSISQGLGNNLISCVEKLRLNLIYLEKFSKILIHSKELNKYILNYPGRKTSGSGKGDFAIELRLEDVEKRSAYEICLRV
ncbi:hypothetical protein [Sneathia sanguinegens]|uniref:mevalonate kinase family protein n=1 Tax=Sneathia sanguinegens TaxID=40543 RepID=UPI002585CDF0|nr:hypothetical protein [Sneathia sanguinegens]MDU4652401.1 hypothetical protein [Sneathia sanguinegens]